MSSLIIYHSVDQLTEANRTAGLNAEYVQIGRGKYVGRFPARVHSQSGFGIETTSVAIAARGQVAEEAFYVVTGDERVIVDGKACRQDELVIYPPGSEFHCATVDAACGIQMSMPKAFVEEYVESTELAASSDSLDSPVRLSLAPGDAARFKSLVTDLALAESDESARAHDVEAFVVAHLSDAISGTSKCDETRGRGRPAADHSGIFRRAREYIMDNLDANISLTDVCVATRTPARTLQRVFLQCAGVSPRAYIYACKLNAIRYELSRGSEPWTNVSDVAFRYGVNHLGRLSANYYELFGEYPSTSLSRSRAALSPST